MVIGLRLRTNEREVTWRYPVAVLGGGMWKGLKEAGREDDERIKVWLVVVLGYTRIRGDERRQRYDEKKRERERKRGMGWGWRSNAAGYVEICMRRMQPLPRTKSDDQVSLACYCLAIASSANATYIKYLDSYFFILPFKCEIVTRTLWL